jgi:hypothetical protein
MVMDVRDTAEMYGLAKLAKLVTAIVVLYSAAAAAQSGSMPPLKNPALLNVGFICHWQSSCITKQMRAMRSSLQYVNGHRVPTRQIELCNRNASRNGTRKDWVGFNRCVRNPTLMARPARRI